MSSKTGLFRISSELGLVFLCSLLAGTLLGALVLSLFLSAEQVESVRPATLFELFTRIALIVILGGMGGYVALRFRGRLRSGPYGLRIDILLGVYLIGVTAALLDPFSTIRSEFNLIRYPTAIVLTVAGAVLIHTVVTKPRHMVYRVLGGMLGVVLMIAAADEILQFHESMNTLGENLAAEETDIAGQDLVTLVVAVAGIVAAFLVVSAVSFLDRRSIFGTSGREVLAAQLLFAGGVAFLTAMLLDTFDTGLSGVFSAVFSSPAILAGQPLSGYVETLANSLEEFLEYATAVLLLSAAFVFHFER